jgi:hypothetical protein
VGWGGVAERADGAVQRSPCAASGGAELVALLGGVVAAHDLTGALQLGGLDGGQCGDRVGVGAHGLSVPHSGGLCGVLGGLGPVMALGHPGGATVRESASAGDCFLGELCGL